MEYREQRAVHCIVQWKWGSETLQRPLASPSWWWVRCFHPSHSPTTGCQDCIAKLTSWRRLYRWWMRFHGRSKLLPYSVRVHHWISWNLCTSKTHCCSWKPLDYLVRHNYLLRQNQNRNTKYYQVHKQQSLFYSPIDSHHVQFDLCIDTSSSYRTPYYEIGKREICMSTWAPCYTIDMNPISLESDFSCMNHISPAPPWRMSKANIEKIIISSLPV